MSHVRLCCGLVAVTEYERVVGREGSDAVSPPRDGAAWALRNTVIREFFVVKEFSSCAKCTKIL